MNLVSINPVNSEGILRDDWSPNLATITRTHSTGPGSQRTPRPLRTNLRAGEKAQQDQTRTRPTDSGFFDWLVSKRSELTNHQSR